MKINYYAFFLFVGLLFMSCSSTSLTCITVASEYGAFCDGEGNVLRKSYIIKTNNDGNWYLLPTLKGFPYEAGYEYVVNVSGSYQNGYEYESIVQKQKKLSEGIPPLLLWDNDWKEPVYCDVLKNKYLEK